MVNKPLSQGLISGGGTLGGWLTSHKPLFISEKTCLLSFFQMGGWWCRKKTSCLYTVPYIDNLLYHEVNEFIILCYNYNSFCDACCATAP